MLDSEVVSIARCALDKDAVSSRFDLRESIVQGGYRYWTDARFAIRMKSYDADTRDFPRPDIAALQWPREESMRPWPKEPDEVFYEYGRSRIFFGKFRSGKLREIAVAVDGALIDPKYFAIVSRLTKPEFCHDSNGHALLVRAKDVEAIVMRIDPTNRVDYLAVRRVPGEELVERFKLPVAAEIEE